MMLQMFTHPLLFLLGKIVTMRNTNPQNIRTKSSTDTTANLGVCTPPPPYSFSIFAI